VVDNNTRHTYGYRRDDAENDDIWVHSTFWFPPSYFLLVKIFSFLTIPNITLVLGKGKRQKRATNVDHKQKKLRAN